MLRDFSIAIAFALAFWVQCISASGKASVASVPRLGHSVSGSPARPMAPTPTPAKFAVDILWVEPRVTPERTLAAYLNGLSEARFEAFNKSITDEFPVSRITVVQTMDKSTGCVVVPFTDAPPAANRVQANEFPVLEKMHHAAEALQFFNQQFPVAAAFAQAKRNLPTVRLVVLVTETVPAPASAAAQRAGEYRVGGCSSVGPTADQVRNSFRFFNADLLVVNVKSPDVQRLWDKTLPSTADFALKSLTMREILVGRFDSADKHIVNFVKHAAQILARRRFPELFKEEESTPFGNAEAWVGMTTPAPTVVSYVASQSPSIIVSLKRFVSWLGF